MKLLAATYARVSLKRQVSDDSQEEKFSLPSQRDAMLKLAEEKGYDVPPELEFVDPGLSGVSPGLKRPQFARCCS